MCGICGIASARGAADPERLAAMSATLVHRGPDSDGAFVDGPVGLAARRLSIIDLDSGDQPIANEDGTVVVVQNGEIYNYAELTDELVRAGDRYGIKPLYYRVEGGGIEFASELRALPRGDIDLDALEGFLAFNSV